MEEKQQLDIELNHEVAQGTYANLRHPGGRQRN